MLHHVPLHDLCLEPPQGPTDAPWGRLGTGHSDAAGCLCASKNPRDSRRRAVRTAQDGLTAFVHQGGAHPVHQGRAGFQRLEALAVTPPFTRSHNVGLQEYPRLQPTRCRACALPDAIAEPLPFLIAQSHDLFLYGNLFFCHDRLRRWGCNKNNS